MESVMKKTTLIFAISGIAASFAYANPLAGQNPPPPPSGNIPLPAFERDPAQTAVNTKSAISVNEVKEDLLRQQKLSQQASSDAGQAVKYTGKELIENPAVLEELFLTALITSNKAVLPVYIKLYQQVPNKDQSLIDWGNAILQRDEDLSKSVDSYRSLISHFPDNNFIRFQLAETLFYNQEFEAAKGQFERLRASDRVQQQDIVVFDRYLEAINSKEDWDFSFGLTFLNDKNLANSAKQGTQMTLPNGHTITYSTPRQEGKGFSGWLGADKRWSLNNGKYIAFDTSLSNKYYWDNKRYNDLNGRVGLGIGYANARLDIQFTPYINKRWYGGGFNGSDSLKRYSNTYGAGVALSYWLNQKVKYSAYYNYGYDLYEKRIDRNQYDGAMHSLTNSVLYYPSSTQYWSLSLDYARKHARNKTNAYERIGSRLTWGQEWPLGIVTSATAGIAKRTYKQKTFLGPIQDNNEYSTSISLWHKKIHYAGFTPKVTWSYSKTDSNIPIYSYDKNQIFFDVTKSF